MRMDAVLSNLYNVKSTAIGAAPKIKEKPKESFVKEIDGVCIMRMKVNTNWVRYAIKLPSEKSERYVIIRPNSEEGSFRLSISLPVPPSDHSGQPSNELNAGFECDLQKSEDKYTASDFAFVTSRINNKDRTILSSILTPLSEAEEETEYKKMLDAAIKSLK